MKIRFYFEGFDFSQSLEDKAHDYVQLEIETVWSYIMFQFYFFPLVGWSLRDLCFQAHKRWVKLNAPTFWVRLHYFPKLNTHA